MQRRPPRQAPGCRRVLHRAILLAALLAAVAYLLRAERAHVNLSEDGSHKGADEGFIYPECFDFAYYREHSPDLVAHGYDVLRLYEHYTDHGIAEGRKYRSTCAEPPEVDLAGLEAKLSGVEDRLRRHLFKLPPAARRRGLAYSGGGARMRAFAAKLLAGKAVAVMKVGGSITVNDDARTYGYKFMAWLGKAFPPAPGTEHSLINNGRSGATSATTAFKLCPDLVPPGTAVDLIVLELAVNDESFWPFDSPERADFESLLRRALNAPGRPAVLLLESYAYLRAEARFWDSSEPDQALVAQFYDVPVLSLRNAAYHLFRRQAPGFRVDKVFEPNTKFPATLAVSMLGPEDNPSDFFYIDQIHPTLEEGHWALADLLVAATGAAALDEVRARAEAKPAHPLDEEEAELPPRTLPGAVTAVASKCFTQDTLAALLVGGEGYAYEAHRPDAPNPLQQKWAVTGHSAGAWAELEVPLPACCEGSPGGGGDVAAPGKRTLYLEFMRSYESMGRAEASCVSGCTCAPAVLDGIWERPATQPDTVPLEVEAAGESCRVQVKSAASPGHEGWAKISLVGVAVR